MTEQNPQQNSSPSEAPVSAQPPSTEHAPPPESAKYGPGATGVSAETSPPPQVNLGQEVVMPDGQKVTLGNLIARAQKAQHLEEYRHHASVLMQGSGEVPTHERERAIRYVMSEEGYSPEQIDEYVQMTKEAGRPDGGEQITDTPQTQTEQGPPTSQGMDPELEARVRAMEQSHNESQVQIMRDTLNREVERALQSHTGLAVLGDVSKKLNPVDDSDPASASGGFRATMQAELERTTLEALRARRARGESFNMGWFQEEVAKAADGVYAKYRSVIGDPDKLQRAPETESTQESFVRREPIKPPTFEKGDTNSSVRDKTHAWTTDVLTRLAFETPGQGKTKV